MKQVMVVDRSPAIRQALEEGLRRAGIPAEGVSMFERADEMIRRFTEVGPDVVLIESEPMGIGMYDAVEAMLLEQPNVRIIVLVTDAHKQSKPVQDALAFGVFGLLEKPIRREDVGSLLDTVRQEHAGAGRIR